MFIIIQLQLVLSTTDLYFLLLPVIKFFQIKPDRLAVNDDPCVREK